MQTIKTSIDHTHGKSVTAENYKNYACKLSMLYFHFKNVSIHFIKPTLERCSEKGAQVLKRTHFLYVVTQLTTDYMGLSSIWVTLVSE